MEKGSRVLFDFLSSSLQGLFDVTMFFWTEASGSADKPWVFENPTSFDVEVPEQNLMPTLYVWQCLHAVFIVSSDLIS